MFASRVLFAAFLHHVLHFVEQVFPDNRFEGTGVKLSPHFHESAVDGILEYLFIDYEHCTGIRTSAQSSD